VPCSASIISAVLSLDRDASALTFTQISLRGIIVFVATLVIVRCGEPLSVAEDRL